ncbi:MAG: NINE protein [Clostridiales bacterium]|nr:NINE protein [Clostridiales bacterium]
MYCKNCGNVMPNEAVVCTNCGVPKGSGNNFCPNCGKQTAPQAVVCTNCGVSLSQSAGGGAQKSKIAAGVLGILIGSFGVHNFYLGYTTKAVIQLLITVCTCGIGAPVSAIWGLVEGIMILTGSIATDAKGMPLQD